MKSQRRTIRHETVLNYLSALTEAFLVSRVPRYDIRGRALLATDEKHYLGDHGIVRALFGYSVGFIGGVLVLPSFLHHFHLDELPAKSLADATAATVSAWLVGAVLGVPLGMPVCSRLGRKNCTVVPQPARSEV